MNSKHFQAPFFIALLLFSAALIVFIFFPYLNALVLAITLAILFQPIYQALKKFMPRWDGLMAFITILFAIIIILAPLIFFGFLIFQEAQGLYTHIVLGNTGYFFKFIHEKLYQLIPSLNIDLIQYAKQMLGILVGNLGVIFSGLSNIVMTFFLALVTFYYLLKDAPKLQNAVVRISPLSNKDTNEILSKLRIMANSVIRGSLIIAIIQGFCVGLGFLIFGLANPVLWGAVSIIAALVPVIGVALVVLPGILSLVISGNVIGSIGFAIWCFLLVGLVENFLRPRLIERHVKIHQILVLFSVLGGFAVFGATGFLLGPLALSLFLALIEIYPTLILERDGEELKS